MALRTGLAAAFGLALAVTACSGANGGGGGGDGSGAIGPSGGTVSLSSGVSVQVPANALPASTTLTITEDATAAPPQGALGHVFRFGPAGTTFAAPVTVSFPVPAGTTAASIYWTTGDGTAGYDAIPTTVSGTTATGQVTHFSAGFVGAACTTGAACMPANPCHHGITICHGTPTCADQGTPLADGASCCVHGACNAGFCQASTFDGTWVASAIRCGGAAAVGRLASWITPPSAFEVVQDGATSYGIWTDGACTITQQHHVAGTFACSPSAAACLAYSTARFGGQICGAPYDDTVPAETLVGPVPACAGGSVVVSSGNTTCTAFGGGAEPTSFTMVRQ